MMVDYGVERRERDTTRKDAVVTKAWIFSKKLCAGVTPLAKEPPSRPFSYLQYFIQIHAVSKPKNIIIINV